MAAGVAASWLNRKELRYKLRSSLRRVTSLHRLTTCGLPLGGPVVVKLIGSSHYYNNLVSCGSGWACPVCAAKIRNRRANEASRAVVSALSQGMSMLFVTRTIPHTADSKLAVTLRLLGEGRRYVVNQTVVKAARKAAGYVGGISAKELTYGRQGWHPHNHDFEFYERDISLEDYATLSRLYYVYLDQFYTANGFPGLSREYGVVVEHVQFGEAVLAKYLTKMQEGSDVRLIAAQELARSDLKRGRVGSLMPFDVALGFIETGDMELLDIWHEFERETFGRSVIRFTKGLRARLLPNEAEQTDEELAAQTINGAEVVRLDSRL